MLEANLETIPKKCLTNAFLDRHSKQQQNKLTMKKNQKGIWTILAATLV